MAFLDTGNFFRKSGSTSPDTGQGLLSSFQSYLQKRRQIPTTGKNILPPISGANLAGEPFKLDIPGLPQPKVTASITRSPTPVTTAISGGTPRTPTGLTETEALDLQERSRLSPALSTVGPTPITTRAESVTKPPRDQLIDLLLDRAREPFDFKTAFKTAREEVGLPGLEESKTKFVEGMTRVEDLLSKLEKDITERTAPFATTGAYRRRLEAKERQPLAEELATQERGLRTTEAAIAPREQLVQSMLQFQQASRKEQLDALTQAVQLGDKDRSSVISLATSYPEASISPDDDIQTAMTKAQPYATEKKELERTKELASIAKTISETATEEEKELGLDKIRAEINKLNADAGKARKGGVTKVSAQVEKKLLETAGVENLLNQVESMVTPLLTPGGPISRIIGGIRGGIPLPFGLRTPGLASTGLDPQAKVYNDFRQGIIGQVARAISQEVGVLTDRDIERADKLIPKLTDTPTEAATRMKVLRELITANKRNLQTTAQSGAAALVGQGIMKVQAPDGSIYEYDIDDPELEEALDNGFIPLE